MIDNQITEIRALNGAFSIFFNEQSKELEFNGYIDSFGHNFAYIIHEMNNRRKENLSFIDQFIVAKEYIFRESQKQGIVISGEPFNLVSTSA